MGLTVGDSEYQLFHALTPEGARDAGKAFAGST
jgi:hypothetical protein